MKKHFKDEIMLVSPVCHVRFCGCRGGKQSGVNAGPVESQEGARRTVYPARFKPE